jgi:hypothetical protein
MFKKPAKKTDLELFTLIEQKIKQREYVFLNHARQRQLERNISDLDVLNILEGKQGYDRTRNKKKDIYEPQYIHETPEDWRYCIEGRNIDGKKVRIIITFTDNLMPVITVINLR